MKGGRGDAIIEGNPTQLEGQHGERLTIFMRP